MISKRLHLYNRLNMLEDMSEVKHTQFMYDLSAGCIRLYNNGVSVSIVSIYDDVDIIEQCIEHLEFYEVRIVFKRMVNMILFGDWMNTLHPEQTCIVFKIRKNNYDLPYYNPYYKRFY